MDVAIRRLGQTKNSGSINLVFAHRTRTIWHPKHSQRIAVVIRLRILTGTLLPENSNETVLAEYVKARGHHRIMHVDRIQANGALFC